MQSILTFAKSPQLVTSLGLPQNSCQFCNLIQVTIYAESLVKICTVDAEIFKRIFRFLPSRPKRCSCHPRNLWGDWTDLDHICTLCSYSNSIEYSWVGTALFLLASNASLPNEGHFAKLATSLEELKGQDRLSMKNTYHFGAKIAKIGPVDPEIIGLRVIIKKEINASNIYRPVGKFAELAKLSSSITVYW